MMVETLQTSGMTPQLMRTADQLSKTLYRAVTEALDAGVNPAMVMGNLECAKMAVYTMMSSEDDE